MIRVVMLLSNPFRPDTRVLKEATSLAEAGHEITILAWDRAGELPAEERLPSGVRVQRIQNVPSTYAIGARQLLRLPRFWAACQPWLSQLKPGLVHCHDFDTLPAGLWWGKLHRVPVIYDAHEYYADLTRPRLHGASGRLLYRLIRIAEHNGARLASAVITVDETLGAIYRQLNRRVVVVGHYPSRALAERGAPVFTRPSLTLLYSGRLSTDRGLKVYAGILRALLGMGLPARLVLAGVYTPAREEKVLAECIAGIESRVNFRGWVTYSQMPKFLQEGDVGLSILLPEPRYVAALPVKLFEYMAAGLPVVASNFPLISEVVNRTRCGILVDPLSNPAQIAAQIAAWWQDPSEARAAGERGRQAVLEQYNWEALAAKIDTLYRSLLPG